MGLVIFVTVPVRRFNGPRSLDIFDFNQWRNFRDLELQLMALFQIRNQLAV
jgi:hypothetical protein